MFVYAELEYSLVLLVSVKSISELFKNRITNVNQLFRNQYSYLLLKRKLLLQKGLFFLLQVINLGANIILTS